MFYLPMKFVISVQASPQSSASRRALKFAQAVLSEGHEILRIFLYQDGVCNATSIPVLPQDELDLGVAWAEFIQQHQLDAVVCVAAALRRGILNTAEAQRYGRKASVLSDSWELSGLGQLHEAIQQADRLVSFGGS